MRKAKAPAVPPNLMEGLPSLAQIVEQERGADVFKVRRGWPGGCCGGEWVLGRAAPVWRFLLCVSLFHGAGPDDWCQVSPPGDGGVWSRAVSTMFFSQGRGERGPLFFESSPGSPSLPSWSTAVSNHTRSSSTPVATMCWPARARRLTSPAFEVCPSNWVLVAAHAPLPFAEIRAGFGTQEFWRHGEKKKIDENAALAIVYLDRDGTGFMTVGGWGARLIQSSFFFQGSEPKVLNLVADNQMLREWWQQSLELLVGKVNDITGEAYSVMQPWLRHLRPGKDTMSWKVRVVTGGRGWGGRACPHSPLLLDRTSAARLAQHEGQPLRGPEDHC